MSKSALMLGPCSYWTRPQAKHYDEARVDPSDTQKRDTGTATHHLLDLSFKEVAGTGTSDPVAHRLAKAGWDWFETNIRPLAATVFSEVAVGINWLTGESELLGGIKDRNYPDRTGWQYGTADVVCAMKDGSLYVLDWKTGEADGATEQLLSLALAIRASRPAGKVPVTINCVQLKEPKELNEDGVWPHEHKVTEEELSNHWDAMVFRTDDILSGDTSGPVLGMHCTKLYCPHLAYCPAVAGGVLDAASRDPDLIPTEAILKKVLNDEPSSDKEAGETMAVISAARRQMKYVETGLKAYVEKQGGRVELNGFVWGPGNNGWRWRKA